MTSDFERFSRLVLDAIQEFRNEFEDFGAETSERLGRMEERLTSIERELAEIDRRLSKLEEDVADIHGYAKELDELRTRLNAIEHHLGLDERIAA